jgi:CDP-diacylglycerol--serine O-phosphatidyltransferase
MTPTNPTQPQPKSRRSVYAIPSTFTTANIFCGFYAVISALKGYQALPHDIAEATRLFDHSAKAIGFAVLFDAIDGSIARMTRTTSDFGIELDSLADVLSFGIAASLLAYAWGYGSMPDAFELEVRKVAWAVSFVYLICGAFRLARFNVSSRRSTTPQPKGGKSFVGLPIPAAAGVIAAIVHFTPTPLIARQPVAYNFLGQHIELTSATVSLLFLVLVASLSILMISTLRYRSFKDLGAGTFSPRWTFLILSLLVSGIYFYSRWALLILAVTYASHALVIKAFSLLRLTRHETPSVKPATK